MKLSKNSVSGTYFRQDLFPAYLFSGDQFHGNVIFCVKSISDPDAESEVHRPYSRQKNQSKCRCWARSLKRLYGEIMYATLKIMVS